MRRVQVDEVDGLIRDMVPEDIQVVAVVEDVRLHREEIVARPFQARKNTPARGALMTHRHQKLPR